MRRLAAESVLPSDSSSRNPEHVQTHVPPGGYEQPAKRFLEIFQKHENLTRNEQKSIIQHISCNSNTSIKILTCKTPLTWIP